jgi:hypothetical protein
MQVITEEDLLFFHEAHRAFLKDEELATYRNDSDTYIALRTSKNDMRDSILIYRIDSALAEFEGVLNPAPPLVTYKYK